MLENRIKAQGMKPEDLWWYMDLRRYGRSEEHTSELQSQFRISYAVFCLKKKKKKKRKEKRKEKRKKKRKRKEKKQP